MKDLRSFIKECESRLPEEFFRVGREVDARHEISAIVKKLDLKGKHPLLFFEKVKGSGMPIVCNTDRTLTKYGVAFGVPPEEVWDYYDKSEEECLRKNPYPMKEVAKSAAPCKEVVKTGKAANLSDFPFLTHYEGEVPYVTLAIGIVNDEEAGCPQTAHYRLMVKKSDLGVTHITPGRHLWNIWKAKSERNEPLEVAFALGLHPAVAMAAQSRIDHPPSEFDVAGSLLKESLEMVRCETIDVLVPAASEIVIEGEIPPHTLEEEGPWGDFTRYHQVDKRHPVRIKAITHRKGPIVHDMGDWPSTVLWPMPKIPLETYMTRQLKKAIPDVKAFRTGPLMYGFIKLDKKHVAQPKQAILAAFGSDIYLKYVVCFDTDIDIEKGSDMVWALLTRVQGDRDIMILPAVMGSDLDLSAPEEGVVTKVGVDATAKPFRKDLPPVAIVPKEVMDRIELKDYLDGFED